jgi:hypothetical protein
VDCFRFVLGSLLEHPVRLVQRLVNKATCQPKKRENWYEKTFGLNPRVEFAPPRRLVSNWRDCPERENLRNVADTGNGRGWRCCQDNGRGELVRERCGSPSDTFRTFAVARAILEL